MSELRRSIRFPGLVLYGLGTTIGAGIYALTGVLAGRAGWLMPLAFLAAAALALFTAFGFAELSSRFPRAGGEAIYVQEGFGRRWLSTGVGLLVAAAGVVSAATVSVGFVGYLMELVAVPRVPAIVAVVLAVGAVAARGVRESVWVAGSMTLLEVGGLLAVIAVGLAFLPELPERLPAMVPRGLGDAWSVTGAAILAFYAFLGFEDMVNVAEEVHDVRRVLPRAILTVLALTALLYLGVSTVALLVVPPEELAASAAPLARVFTRAGGPAGVLSGIALFALLNGALIQLVKASRVLYGLSRQGWLPAAFGRVHRRTRTPLLATAVVTGFATVLAASFPLGTLAEGTAVVTLVTFGLANASLLVVKRRDPRPAGVVVYPAWLPACGVVVSAVLLAVELRLRAG